MGNFLCKTTRKRNATQAQIPHPHYDAGTNGLQDQTTLYFR
jgi:hypothetical protein